MEIIRDLITPERAEELALSYVDERRQIPDNKGSLSMFFKEIFPRNLIHTFVIREMFDGSGFLHVVRVDRIGGGAIKNYQFNKLV